MNKAAEVFYNHIVCGTLEKTDAGYRFTYNNSYFNNAALPAISLSLPKSQTVFESGQLFPFFYGLLSEGVNKELQCRTMKIDENDHFTRLIKTAGKDTIGAITLKELKR